MPLVLSLVLSVLGQGVVLPSMPVTLEGSIRGTLSVDMSLLMRDGRFYGFYHHKEYAGVLSVAGSINGIGLLQLKEYDQNGVHTATFEGRFVSPTRFKGARREQASAGIQPFDLRVTAGPFNRNRVGLSHQRFFWQSPDERCKLEFKYPLVSAHAAESIRAAVNAVLKERLGEVDPGVECRGSEAGALTLTGGYAVTLNASGFLSLRQDFSFHMQGAAHPGLSYDGLTFDLHSGRLMALNDLFAPDQRPAFKTLAEETARQRYAVVQGSLPDSPLLPQEPRFLLREDGIYLLGLFSGHAASLEVALPYSVLANLLKPDVRLRLLKGVAP